MSVSRPMPLPPSLPTCRQPICTEPPSLDPLPSPGDGRSEARRTVLGNLLFVIALFVLGGLCPSTLQAAVLAGTVVDMSSTPLAGARIEIRPLSEDAPLVIVSDDEGSFTAADLAPGTYRVVIIADGFEPLAADVELVGTGDRQSRRFSLRRYVLESEITVTAALPELVTGHDIDRRQIEERGLADLVAVLRTESGLSAVRRGPINLDPTVRGLQETQVAVMVDGSRTFAAGPGRMDSDASHLSQHAVEDVQVVKGPYALTWGAGAMSALELRTARAPFSAAGVDAGGRLAATGTNNDEVLDGFADLWVSGRRLALRVSHNERSGDDYRAGDDREVPADFSSSDSRWSVDARTGSSTLLRYSGGYQGQDDIDYPGRLLDATYFKTGSHNLELDWVGGSQLTAVHAQAYTNRKSHLMNNDEKPTARPMPARMPPFALRVELPAESDTSGGRLAVELGRGKIGSKIGLDVYRSEQSALRRVYRRLDDRLLFEDIVWPDARIDDAGIYWQSIYRAPRLELGGTVRLDLVGATAGEVSDFFREHTTGELDQNETNLSAALSLALQVTDRWLLHAGVGRAVRTANALERYSDRFPATKFQLPAEFMGDPAIDPEASFELDLGSRWSAGNSLLVSADIFYREIDDYITVEADPSLPPRLPLSPPVVFRYRNGTRATFWGGELRISQQVGAHVEWRGAFDWVRGEDELFAEPVLGLPPLRGVFGVRLHTSEHRYWSDVSVHVSDSQDRVASSRFERPTPGYTTCDALGGVRLRSGLELTLGIENLTDKTYSHHLNSPNPFTGARIPEIGRNVRLSASYRF